MECVFLLLLLLLLLLLSFIIQLSSVVGLISVDVICDLPCAASLAGIQPVRPRAQRTSP